MDDRLDGSDTLSRALISALRDDVRELEAQVATTRTCLARLVKAIDAWADAEGGMPPGEPRAAFAAAEVLVGWSPDDGDEL